MRTISATELRRGLGRFLDAASAGERIVIERNHRPVAMLVSIEDGRRLDEPEEQIARRLAALDRLERLGTRLAEAYPSDLASVDAVRADRDRDD